MPLCCRTANVCLKLIVSGCVTLHSTTITAQEARALSLLLAGPWLPMSKQLPAPCCKALLPLLLLPLPFTAFSAAAFIPAGAAALVSAASRDAPAVGLRQHSSSAASSLAQSIAASAAARIDAAC
jgi:hypothetical protein